MNSDEQHEALRVQTTAVISAIVEGVRGFGPLGVDEDALYEAISRMCSRGAFEMIIAELIKQKTVKRDLLHLVYCGPSPLSEPRVVTEIKKSVEES